MALGVALGATMGLVLLLSTLLLVIKGGDVVGPHLSLLAQFYPGYRVSVVGSLIGLGYGFLTGFVGGWIGAFLRNGLVYLAALSLRRREERRVMGRIWDYL